MNNVIPIKEKLALNDLFDNNKVKQIKWGETFEAWPADKQLKYAKSLASAMNEAADKMQQDRDKCYQGMIQAQDQRVEAEDAAALSKKTMVQAVMDSNAKTRELENEILLLNQRLKAYE